MVQPLMVLALGVLNYSTIYRFRGALSPMCITQITLLPLE